MRVHLVRARRPVRPRPAPGARVRAAVRRSAHSISTCPRAAGVPA